VRGTLNTSTESCGTDYYAKGVAPTVLNCFGKSYPLCSRILPHTKEFCFFFLSMKQRSQVNHWTLHSGAMSQLQGES